MGENNSVALTIGGEVKSIGLAVSGKLFVFSPVQMQFLLNLQRLKNVMASALAVDKDESWGQGFLRSKKFRQYIVAKMDEFSVRNGLTVEWWYQFGKWSAEGKKEFYQAHCPACAWDGRMNCYEVESYRGDDMQLAVPCPACFQTLVVEKKDEPFKPTREQVVAWQDLGDRLIPKIERVHHEFEKSEIVFEPKEG